MAKDNTFSGMAHNALTAETTIVGKQGYKYTPMCGFCLETQYFPDFPNHSEFPQGVVFPEKPYHHTTLYKLSVV